MVFMTCEIIAYLPIVQSHRVLPSLPLLWFASRSAEGEIHTSSTVPLPGCILRVHEMRWHHQIFSHHDQSKQKEVTGVLRYSWKTFRVKTFPKFTDKSHEKSLQGEGYKLSPVNSLIIIRLPSGWKMIYRVTILVWFKFLLTWNYELCLNISSLYQNTARNFKSA